MHSIWMGHMRHLYRRPGRLAYRRAAVVVPVLGALLALWAASPEAGSTAAQAGTPTVAGCQVFPADNVWNARVDGLPIHPRSDDWVRSIGATTGLHPDFGAGTWNGAPIGIPYTTVPGSQPPVSISFEYADESDPGPYRIPPDAPIEGGGGTSGDRHVIVVDRDRCTLAEVFASEKLSDTAWRAGSGATFDLNSNALRPATWTSADAAGLPIFPGLARYDEVAAGEIAHALRFTAPRTQRAYLWPARHFASDSTNPALPPMGARFRLKSDVNPAAYPHQVRVILTALQRYGMILADNGSAWYVSGAPDPGWNDDTLRQLRQIVGNRFEAVDASSLMVHPDSAQVRASGPIQTPMPTVVPTATPTATPRPSCSPRPPVRVASAPGGASAPGVLLVTIEAQAGAGALHNALDTVRVAELANARVELDGRALATGETASLPAATQQVTLVVRRATAGAAATARLVVTDACGPWPTFVGGGPTAF